MLVRPLSVLLLMASSLIASDLAAQSIGASPTYGSVNLRAGFLPDPHVTDLTAGGSVEVNRGSCSYGKVANSPDVDLYYEGSGGNTLYIYAESKVDITLLINLPNGSWECDDDGYQGLNPLLIVRNAPSGLYNVWVGTYGSDMASARLMISEIDPRNR
jgi:hypothetical protein